jgi:hypothetical protein
MQGYGHMQPRMVINKICDRYEKAFQIMMKEVCAGQVLSLQSILSLCIPSPGRYAGITCASISKQARKLAGTLKHILMQQGMTWTCYRCGVVPKSDRLDRDVRQSRELCFEAGYVLLCSSYVCDMPWLHCETAVQRYAWLC